MNDDRWQVEPHNYININNYENTLLPTRTKYPKSFLYIFHHIWPSNYFL